MRASRRQPRISFAISSQVSRYLDQLLAVGLYGRSRAGVARELLYSAVRAQEMKKEIRR